MAPDELARTAYTVECFLNALRLDDGRERTEIEERLVKWLSRPNNTTGYVVFSDGNIFCHAGKENSHVTDTIPVPAAKRQHAVWCNRKKLSEIDADSYAGSGKLVMLGTAALLLALPGSSEAATAKSTIELGISSNNNNNNNNNNNG
jgi:hypothetical protein